MIKWTDKYIGIPFIPNGRNWDGVDCWGVVHLIFKNELGITLPEYKDIFMNMSKDSLHAAAKAYDIGKLDWDLVTKPKPFDVVMLRTGKFLWHVGVVVDKRNMIHALDGVAVCIEDFTSNLWRHKVEEFRRYPTK